LLTLRKTAELLCLGMLIVVIWADESRAQEGIADSILQLSNNQRVKIAWQRDTTAAGDNVFGGASVFNLYVYDTEDDTIRNIRSTNDDYTKPLITYDGERIVYTDRVERKIYVVNFDGSNRRFIANGFAGTLWYDADSGKEWIYYQRNFDGGNSSEPLNRINIDNTNEIELIWNASDNNVQWLSISSDSTRLAASWPWSQCGMIVPDYDGSGDGDLYSSGNGYYVNGCWTTITPDENYRVGVFDGPHRNWLVYDTPHGGNPDRTLVLNSAPGINDWEIYHPKLANHPRFLMLNGPYSIGSMGQNNITKGGPQIEIYLGKLDQGFTQVTDWVKITSDNRADFFPCAWIDPGVSPRVRIDSLNATPDTITTGGTSTLSWETTYATSVSLDQGIGAVGLDGSRAVSPNQDTTYTLTAEGQDGPVSRQVTVTVWTIGDIHLRINCGDGSPAVANWADEDSYRTGGASYDFSDPVDLNNQTNAAPADVYRTCIHQNHSYDILIPDGDYTVRLHFFDNVGSSGRAMDYTIEGVKVLDDFSISDEAPGGGKALVKEFLVTVNDGNGLQIIAEQDQGNDVFETGIEIHSLSADTEDPAVMIDAPVSGANVSGDLLVQGRATDNQAIDKVEVRVDDLEYQLAAGTNSWTHTLFTTILEDGPHTLTARATDIAGNTGTVTINFFSNNSQAINITRPAGGEIWQAGDTEYIQWTTDNLDNVTIFYSLDGGTTFHEMVQTIFDTEPKWGNYPWVVPNINTNQALIQIQGYFGEVPTSSSLFSIVGSGSQQIDLLAPLGGETLIGNSQFQVKWQAQEIDVVELSYSLDGGQSFEPLIATVNRTDADWGDFSWDVPNVDSQLAQLRVSSPGGAVQDTSEVFSIEPQSQTSGELEVTLVKFVGRLPEVAGAISEVVVAGRNFTVGADRSFTAEVEVATGVSRFNFEIVGSDGSNGYRRQVQLEIADTAPPIEGLGVSLGELLEFLGGRRGVLVWVDAGSQIRVLDFRQAEPQVLLLSSELDCINPLISPDGSRVVYSQGLPNGTKNIFVSDLTGATQLIASGDVGYWQVSGDQENIIWCDWSAKDENGADGKTYQQKLVTGGLAVDGPAVEIHERAMDGGPNADLTWLGQVYGNLWAHNLASGTDYPTEKFRLLSGDMADHQSCNGSMAPDGSGRLMCLVIPHDYVRVFSYTGASDEFQVSAEYNLPSGMVEWEFPEWSTEVGYFTAVLRASDLQNRLFIVKHAEGRLVPEVLEISGEQKGVTYSHLYLEP